LVFVCCSAHAELQTHESRYYIIHTDLGPDEVREADMRMTRMAEAYYNRTKDFSGIITQRMPFFLYKHAEDYYAAGGPKGTAGYFNPDSRELVALAEDSGPRTWNTVQHEGFHQFAHFMIRGDIPTWLNEGLAEYFGEAIFTGDSSVDPDGFVTGVIPQWRLKRVRSTIKDGGFRPLDEMMQLSLVQWNTQLAVANYDQGWSMVQFLAHGDNGKYQPAFRAFMGALGNGARWQDAWRATFGDTEGFEPKWHDYWVKVPDNPTLDLYLRCNVGTLSSFLARAIAQRQVIASFDAFKEMGAEKKLKSHPQDWLPPSLLEQALKQVDQLEKGGYQYELVARGGQKQIVCTTPDGREVAGSYVLLNGRVTKVSADFLTTKKPAR
jgi:hypothetical protein